VVVVGVVEDVVVDGVVVLVETAVVVAIDCVVVGVVEDVVSSLLEPHATTNEIPSRPVINLSLIDISNCLAPISRIIHGELTTIWIEAQLPAAFVHSVLALISTYWVRVFRLMRSSSTGI